MAAQKKRITVEVDDIYELIEQMADEGRRSKGAEIRLLVDEALVARGLIETRPGVKPYQSDSEVDEVRLQPITLLINKLIEEEMPTDSEIITCANLLKINSKKITALCNLVVNK
ncbi:hypothetical protein [Planktothrix agardhii]|uniref:hypothetical protein n=1 Tax=Planktothrix agardhii TaxID=1160 RepID=UPI0020A7F04A|nr:hypothetical protein [Planktothrix agardhii]CAD5911390.1 hypothetical protein NO758_00064 [Planktothrix agardhii]